MLANSNKNNFVSLHISKSLGQFFEAKKQVLYFNSLQPVQKPIKAAEEVIVAAEILKIAGFHQHLSKKSPERKTLILSKIKQSYDNPFAKISIFSYSCLENEGGGEDIFFLCITNQ